MESRPPSDVLLLGTNTFVLPSFCRTLAMCFLTLSGCASDVTRQSTNVLVAVMRRVSSGSFVSALRLTVACTLTVSICAIPHSERKHGAIQDGINYYFFSSAFFFFLDEGTKGILRTHSHVVYQGSFFPVCSLWKAR